MGPTQRIKTYVQELRNVQYCYTSKVEKEELREKLDSNAFTLSIKACAWFFPCLMQLLIKEQRERQEGFQFEIIVGADDEVSPLQYLAAFLHWRSDLGKNEDRALFLVDEAAAEQSVEKIYGEVSRCLTIFIDEYGLQDRLLFQRTPEYTKEHVRSGRMRDGQLWPFEKGGYGTTGLPLIPIDVEFYELCQKNFYEFIKEDIRNHSASWRGIAMRQGNGNKVLKAVAVREICKRFYNQFKAIDKSKRYDKRKYGNVLKILNGADVLTFLLFGAAFFGIYNPGKSSVTVNARMNVLMDKNNFLTLYERCCAYAMGLVQLIENTISYTSGGFLSLRAVRRGSEYLKGLLKDPNNQDDFLIISICDVACLTEDKKYMDMRQKFLENLRPRNAEGPVNAILENDSKLEMKDLFFPKPDGLLMNYLCEPQNTGFHYGLQIFASAVEGAGGDFRVTSGDEIQFSTSRLSQETENEEIKKRYMEDSGFDYYYCGTKFDVLLPISGVVESESANEFPIPGELSYEALENIDPCQIAIDYKVFFPEIKKIFSQKPAIATLKQKKYCIDMVADAIKKKAGAARKESALSPLVIECKMPKKHNLTTNLFFEVLAKAIFLHLSDPAFPFRNIALTGFESNVHIVAFVRYYAQFYNRFGFNESYAKSSQIMIVSGEKETNSYITLSGKYLGQPLYDYTVFSGGKNMHDADGALLAFSLNKISTRTKQKAGALEACPGDLVNNPHCFDNVELCVAKERMKRWLIDLREAITTDFSDAKRVGSKIKNCVTHMHISGVHIDTFYQIDQIFTNAYWSAKLGEWLAHSVGSTSPGPFVLYGYGHLTEPTLLKAMEGLGQCQYMIYEDGYHYTVEKTSGSDLSFSCPKSDMHAILEKGATVVFIMPISTTMATFKRMGDLLFDEFNGIDSQKINFKFISVFQVIAADRESERISERFFQNCQGSKVIYTEPFLGARSSEKDCYCLLKLGAKWQAPDRCAFCYPEEKGYERMLYTTDDTSLVPTMQLQVFSRSENDFVESQESLDFFEKDKKSGKYLYASALMYQHIERQDSHYSQYIQTNALLNLVIENGKFEQWAKKIKDLLKIKDDKKINIIIAPSHVSNQKFPIEINKAIFDGKAHIISVNATKTYRSNFEAEFSNYFLLADVLRARLKSSGATGDSMSTYIRCFYVDDQINTGATYSRIKSLIQNLFHRRTEDLKNYFIKFDAVITLIDRHSRSSLINYVDDPRQFISLFKVNVPAIRSNGDSCPLCKRVSTDKSLELCAALDTTAKICAERREAHSVNEISDAKKKTAEAMQKHQDECEELMERHMRRFEAENVLWNKIRMAEWQRYRQDESEEFTFLQELYNIIAGEIFRTVDELDDEDEKVEYLISFIKVLPRPFLSFRPFVATAAIALLRGICDSMLSEDFWVKGKDCVSIKLKDVLSTEQTFSMEISLDGEQRLRLVNLLIVCLSGLSGLNSTYILDVDRLKKIVGLYGKLLSDDKIYASLPQLKSVHASGILQDERSFADYIRFSVFQLVHHERYGKTRREKFDGSLQKALKEPDDLSEEAKLFLSLLYLENGTLDKDDKDMQQAIGLLRGEIVGDNHAKRAPGSPQAKMLMDSIAYINEGELQDWGKSKTEEGAKDEKLVLTPITTRGYCDAYNVGFDLHFTEEGASAHTPITQAVNPVTGQLWGKIELSYSARESLRTFGISIFDPTNRKLEDKSKYIFLKFSNSSEFFVQSRQTLEAEKIPQMPSLYLRINTDQGESLLDLLRSVRQIISQRRIILQELAADLSTEDMQKLIAERRFTRALSITKASKHATEEAERMMHYDFSERELSKTLVGQIRRQLANRTISGLYQVESMLFEQENRGEETAGAEKTAFDDGDEISGTDHFMLWAEDDPKDKYTQIWDLLRGGFCISGCKEGDSSQSVRLKFKLDSSVKPADVSYTLRYRSFQEKKLTLDFLFLLANNAIRHLSEDYDTNKIEFTISRQGPYLSVSSPTGKKELDESELIRNARSIVIPPHVRKYFKDEGEKSREEETDGITLWSLSRYFRRLEQHVSRAGEASGIVPISRLSNGVEVGFDYFKIVFEERTEGLYYTVKMKCMKEG